MKRFFIFLSLALTVMLAAAPAEVKVSSFAPGKDDATDAFNAAIASGAKKVIVDNVGFDYIIRPVILRSDLELVFMDKVVVRAKRGEFHGQGDSLFKATDVRNITIRGEGNVMLEMNKSDYQDSSKYSWSEWRMCLSFRGCENVVIRDLTLKSSGGDGIYIGAHKNPGCKNVLIENVICDNHHRQGISVISVDKLIIRNSRFVNTSGTPPACGVDFEPNGSRNFICDVLVENCEFSTNTASGIFFHLLPLDEKSSRPVSAVIRNCRVFNNKGSGFAANIGSVKGEISVDNCIFSGNANAVSLKRMPGNLKLNIENSTFESNGNDFSILCDMPYDTGNIHFKNVKLITPSNNPLSFECMDGFGLVNSSFNFIYGKNTAGMKPFDSAAFLKKYAPDPSKRQSISFMPVNIKDLKPATNVSKDALAHMVIRGKFRFIQAVPAAGTYPIRFDLQQIGRFAVTGIISVRDQNDTLVDRIKVTAPGKNYVYNLKTNSAGNYIFEVDFGGHGVKLHADLPGQGILADNPLKMIWFGKNMYFVVPAAATEVNVEVAGSTGEWVSAKIFDAQKRKVAEVEKIQTSKIMTVKRSPSAKDEVWMLFLRGAEDHSVRLGAPCLPVFYASPENILISK